MTDSQLITSETYRFFSREKDKKEQAFNTVTKWVDDFNAFDTKAARLVEAEKSGLFQPNFDSLEDFVQTSAMTAKQIIDLQQKMNTFANAFTHEQIVTELSRIADDYLLIEAEYIQKKGQYLANKAEAERQLEAKRAQLYSDLGNVLENSAKNILKRTHLRWIVDSQGLVEPYKSNPDQLVDHLWQLKQEIRDFNDPQFIISRLRKLSKGNVAAFAELESLVKAIDEHDLLTRNLKNNDLVRNSINWVEEYSNTISTSYAFFLVRSIREVQYQQTEADRLLALHRDTDLRLNSVGVNNDYFAVEDERKNQRHERILGIKSSDDTEKMFLSLEMLATLKQVHKTQDEIAQAILKKVLTTWQAEHGAEYQSYEGIIEHIQTKMARQNSTSEVTRLLLAQKHTLDVEDEKISVDFINYFRETHPVEAALAADELTELEQRYRSHVLAQISQPLSNETPGLTVKGRDFTGASAIELKKILSEIIACPSEQYYPVLLSCLTKLRVNDSVSDVDNLTSLLFALSACKAELGEGLQTKSAVSVLHRLVDLQRRPEELLFLKKVHDSYFWGGRIASDRAAFFRWFDNGGILAEPQWKRLDRNTLMTTDGEKRYAMYLEIVSRLQNDTLVLETLLRHESSFDQVHTESVRLITNGIRRIKKVHEIEAIKSPSVDVFDLIIEHKAITVDDVGVLEKIRDTNTTLSSKMSFFLLDTLSQEKPITEIVSALGEYNEVAHQSPQIADLFGLFLEHSSDDTLLLLLQSAVRAHQTGNISEWVFQMQKKMGVASEDFFSETAQSYLQKEYSQLDVTADVELTQENWRTVLYTYIQAEADMGFMVTPDTGYVQKVKALFEGEDAKEFCFTQIEALWLSYLEAGIVEEFPLELAELTQVIDLHMGAGPLKYVTALSTFCHAYREGLLPEETAGRTARELNQGMAALERRFRSENWSQNDRADFYQMSSDILSMAPSLFSDFLAVIITLDKNDVKAFIKKALPLYQARLALLNVAAGSSDEYQEKMPKDLVVIRRELRAFRAEVQQDTEDNSAKDNIDTLQQTAITEIKNRFQVAFGIKKIPETFTQEHVRSIQNNARFLANIRNSDEKKEAKLALFLALKLNNTWDSFRQFEAIDLSEYFETDSSHFDTLSKYLSERESSLDAVIATANIQDESIPDFWRILNTEVRNLALMNVQTVDMKLQMILNSLDGLSDPDAYEAQLEKQMVAVYETHGVAVVNSVMAQSFQELNGRAPRFKSPEKESEYYSVQSRIKTAFSACQMLWNTESIQTAQQELKVLASVQKTLNSISERAIPVAIVELQTALIPNSDVVAVFRKMGEDFSRESGAHAVSKDIEYLEDVFSKHRESLDDAERTTVTDYLDSIKQLLIALQDEYQQMQRRFSQLAGSMHSKGVLSDRLNEIQAIISQSSDEKEYVTVCSNDINLIIENIRACLGCLLPEVNNDTNLTFGDPNKFFIMTKSSHSEGSMSDQIVFVEPVTHADGTQEVSIIFDQLYGTRSVDVFMNHITVIWQKYVALKKAFPDANLSVFISTKALSTAGLSRDALKQRLSTIIDGYELSENEASTVMVLPSAGGDHYIELGGANARVSGVRAVDGVVLRLP